MGLILEARHDYHNAASSFRVARHALARHSGSTKTAFIIEVSINLARSLCKVSIGLLSLSTLSAEWILFTMNLHSNCHFFLVNLLLINVQNHFYLHWHRPEVCWMQCRSSKSWIGKVCFSERHLCLEAVNYHAQVGCWARIVNYLPHFHLFLHSFFASNYCLHGFKTQVHWIRNVCKYMLCLYGNLEGTSFPFLWQEILLQLFLPWTRSVQQSPLVLYVDYCITYLD